MPTSLIERSPSAYGYPLLIKQLLHSSLAAAPNQEIVYKDVSRYTYREWWKRVGRLANGLTSLGVKAGDTVAVMDWDTHRYLECYFAIPMMGSVLQTVNVSLSPEEIIYTINHAEANVILCHTDFLPTLEKIQDRLETVRDFVMLSDAAERPSSSVKFAIEYEELLAQSAEQFDFPDFDENTRATTFYTTGTTGKPKGVYFSHRQIVLHTLSTIGTLAIAPEGQRLHRDDVYMPLTPMFHVHAWGMPYIATAMGIKQVYTGRFLPAAALALIQKENVTFSHGVPVRLHMMLTNPAASTVDLSGLKLITGGSALPKGLAKLAVDRGIDVFTGYGMSETCPILSLAQLKSSLSSTEEDWELDYRTRAGLPALLVDLRIVDDEMQDVPHDGKATGEIVARAPWLTQGYLKDPVNSEQLWHGGYLHTNDIGSIDSEGYLQITDRIKDVIKSGGEWISSLTIESIISEYPGVSEVAVIGRPDEKWGERPLALVIATGQTQITESDIQAHVKKSADQGIISKWAVPDVLFIDVLDKTSVGKANKKLLRQKYAQKS